MEPFGGLIETPNMQRIADQGLRYTQFHTTALCSPTRSCLLNGRNATRNGMACITEASTGFPSSNARIPFEHALLSEALVEQGWNTYAIGKWRLARNATWPRLSVTGRSVAASSASMASWAANRINGSPT